MTGNLKLHAEHYHDTTLIAVKKIIMETKKEDVAFAVQAHIDSLTLPQGNGTLQKLWNWDNSCLSAEALALLWFLDAHVAFHQFDNPFFVRLIELLSGQRLPSSFTFIETLLPVVYEYVTVVMVAWLRKARAFWSSFDLWT